MVYHGHRHAGVPRRQARELGLAPGVLSMRVTARACSFSELSLCASLPPALAQEVSFRSCALGKRGRV